MTLTAEGVMRLHRVKAMMRARPAQVDMGRWYYSPDHPSVFVEWVTGLIEFTDEMAARVPSIPLMAMLETNCGTTCCIAGMIIADAGELAVPGQNIPNRAFELIGGDKEGEEGPDLFFSAFWPEDLQNRYNDADRLCFSTSDPDELDWALVERTEIVCEAIDRWIAGGGSF